MTHRPDPLRAVRLAVGLSCVALGVVAGGPGAAQDCLGFTERAVVDEGTNGIEAVHAADLDGDEDLDLLSASFGDGRIFWYENDGGSPPAFTPRLITETMVSASDVFAADLDGDGDLDVLATARATNRVAWFENVGGSPVRFIGRNVSLVFPVRPLSVHAGDLDGDEDVDVVVASFGDDTIAWHENLGGTPPTFEERILTTQADGAASVFAVDLDGDEDLDVLAASRLDATVAWFENVGGSPPVFTEHLISETAAGADAVRADDLDGDGDLDVVSASINDNRITWYESRPNPDYDPENDPRPLLFTERTISSQALGATAVFTADVDGDERIDVLAASPGNDTVAWYRNDGATPPGFVEVVISAQTRSADDVIAADLDGDGDTDVISASSLPGFPATADKLAWFENDGSPSPAFTERRIGTSADGAVAVFGADLDGDGDLDVASAGRSDRIAWHENVGTLVPEFQTHVVSTDARGAVAVLAADLDRDGDLDLLSASEDDDKIAWYENDGAADPTFAERVVSLAADGARSVHVADVNGDELPDILSASAGDGKIAWYENQGGSPPAFAERVVSMDAAGARSVFAADLDGDLDLDLLSASADDDTIAWYESDGADPPAFTEHEISTTALGATAVAAGDLDGDGDVDVAAASERDRTIAWYESDGGSPPSFTVRPLASDFSGAAWVVVVDLDGDADLDIVAVATNQNRVAWFDNDGAAPPTFTRRDVTTGADGVRVAAVADVDGDEDLDLLAGERLKISWFEASGEVCQTFDASGDGVIDGVELVWLGRAFGLSSADPASEWWAGIDLNRDGRIDGEDLAVLAAPGVFGMSTTDCSFVCSP